MMEQGRQQKLISTWTGRWRAVNENHEHVRIVEHIVTRETQDVHVNRMRFAQTAVFRSLGDYKIYSNIWNAKENIMSMVSPTRKG